MNPELICLCRIWRVPEMGIAEMEHQTENILLSGLRTVDFFQAGK
jgi:hypothetical protein